MSFFKMANSKELTFQSTNLSQIQQNVQALKKKLKGKNTDT